MRITVAIKSKNKSAPAVTEPLLTTLEMLKMRGQNELYDNLSTTEQSYQIPLAAPVTPTDIVSATDHELGIVHHGRCVASAIVASRTEISQSITIEVSENA